VRCRCDLGCKLNSGPNSLEMQRPQFEYVYNRIRKLIWFAQRTNHLISYSETWWQCSRQSNRSPCNICDLVSASMFQPTEEWIQCSFLGFFCTIRNRSLNSWVPADSISGWRQMRGPNSVVNLALLHYQREIIKHVMKSRSIVDSKSDSFNFDDIMSGYEISFWGVFT
jgi:hypothetical protein